MLYHIKIVCLFKIFNIIIYINMTFLPMLFIINYCNPLFINVLLYIYFFIPM